MTKPIGPICNLTCRYCYYLEKEAFYPRTHSFRMPDDVLQTYVRDYIAGQPGPEVQFAWQGGEPLLLGIDFFHKAISLQRQFAGEKTITNVIQTNGTLLDDAWCAFFAEHGFLVGISLDGPQALHDAYRRDNRGQPTFNRVMKGVDYLQKHNVAFNTLTVVHRKNSLRPLEVYNFLKTTGTTVFQFIPLVERLPPPDFLPDDRNRPVWRPPPEPDATQTATRVSEQSVRPIDYGDFLIAIFDAWVRRDVGTYFLPIVDVALGNHMSLGSGLCIFAETCGQALALEHNGDLYSCDHYVYPEYRLGNIMTQPLGDMATSPRQQQFGLNKRDTLPRYCRECEVRHLCNGECPKHRFIRTPQGDPGLNYLCAGYKKFFRHITPTLESMADCLRQGRSPAEVMQPRDDS
ncbi:MAG TPA: anaerobic sulfatase maturase [Kiritimatiellia bacterium]|nr:anaerobic sulfatase maturase [Kiritimatiellia bacterium]HMO99367.1 anaerobic sulfatase maturase [Kiritimatiellia bacterium]HMP95646.1 anaerobic sulfatase maturase [Kiritimatiellia bacterium]